MISHGFFIDFQGFLGLILGGQERPGKALKARQKKAWKRQGAGNVWKGQNVPGGVGPTIRGRLLGKPIQAFNCHAILSLVALWLPCGVGKGRQRRPQEAKGTPRDAKAGQRGAKVTPRGPQGGPIGAQGVPKRKPWVALGASGEALGRHETTIPKIIEKRSRGLCFSDPKMDQILEPPGSHFRRF